jgi:hypothetical protein
MKGGNFMCRDVTRKIEAWREPPVHRAAVVVYGDGAAAPGVRDTRARVRRLGKALADEERAFALKPSARAGEGACAPFGRVARARLFTMSPEGEILC